MRVITMQAPVRRVDDDVRLPFDPASPEGYFERRPANFGDYVVIDAMLKLIDVEVVGNVSFGSATGTPLPEADHLVIRGANYIRPNLDLTGMGEVIERLGVPVTIMGIGAQAPAYGPLELSAGTLRALRILGEHSVVVGARGVYTAELLKDLGVPNVEPVGCPSFFQAMNRDLTIRFEPAQSEAVAYNMNRHMSGIYGSNTKAVNRMQRDIFLQLRRRFPRVTAFCQGEPSEFIAAHRLEARYPEMRSFLVRDGFAEDDGDPIIDQFVEGAACGSSIGDWGRKLRGHDVVIGMRFHGTTVGLSNGVPSIYFVNDTRIHELAAYFGVPYVDLRRLDGPPSVEEIFEAADFAVFNAQYRDRFDRFAAYLVGSGLPARIRSGAPVEPAPRYAESELHVPRPAPAS